MPVEGIDDLAQLAKDLRSAGEKGLTKELRAGCQRSIRPLKAAAKAGALEYLPSGGGLGAQIAQSRITGRVSLLGRNPRITMEAKGRDNAAGRKHDLRAMNRGRLRHPLYGNRKHWYLQKVKPGWFTEAMEQNAPAVRQELLKAAGAVLDKLGRPG